MGKIHLSLIQTVEKSSIDALQTSLPRFWEVYRSLQVLPTLWDGRFGIDKSQQVDPGGYFPTKKNGQMFPKHLLGVMNIESCHDIISYSHVFNEGGLHVFLDGSQLVNDDHPMFHCISKMLRFKIYIFRAIYLYLFIYIPLKMRDGNISWIAMLTFTKWWH